MDGKMLADEIKVYVKEGVEKLNRFNIEVGLALLLVGDNPASKQYFLATLKASKHVGIRVYEYTLPSTATMNEILNVVDSINRDHRINGLLILFPLPRSINSRRVVNAISPEKDIDGLGAISVGKLAADESTFQLFQESSHDLFNCMAEISGFLPCTPFGVMRLLEYHNVEIRGKHAVIVGKSLAVGKPLSLMFLAREATVTVCHKETHDLAYFTQQADVICVATGRRNIITDSMVKEGAVVVDIGINVLDDGHIVGDVDYPSVSRKASFITPVPGGVGPVTIAMLLENTLKSAQREERIKSPFMMT